MQKIKITGESTCDLTPEYIKKYNIPLVKFHVQKGDEDLLDRDLTNQEIFDYIDQTNDMCRTSAANIYSIEEMFDKELETNDYIIHFTISGKMSSGYSNAIAAAKGRKNIFVLDSEGNSGEIAIQMIYAQKLIDAGYPFEEICQLLLERRPHAVFTMLIDTMEYLYKGGRCSAMKLIGANLLRVKPSIYANHDKDGALTPGKKYRGRLDRCIKEFITTTFNDNPNPDLSLCYVTYSTFDDKELLNTAVELIKSYGFKEVIVQEGGNVNAIHVGPNNFCLEFYNDGEHEVKPYQN